SGEMGSWQTMIDFETFLAFAHPLAVGIQDPRLVAHGIFGTRTGIVDRERRQLAVRRLCFGGPEIGSEYCRLYEEWQRLGQPGLDRLVLAAYPRVDGATGQCSNQSHAGWMGVKEKEHTRFQWRYRQARPAKELA